MGKHYDIIMWTSERITCDICDKLKPHGIQVESKGKDVSVCDDCAGQALIEAAARRSRL